MAAPGDQGGTGSEAGEPEEGGARDELAEGSRKSEQEVREEEKEEEEVARQEGCGCASTPRVHISSPSSPNPRFFLSSPNPLFFLSSPNPRSFCFLGRERESTEACGGGYVDKFACTCVCICCGKAERRPRAFHRPPYRAATLRSSDVGVSDLVVKSTDLFFFVDGRSRRRKRRWNAAKAEPRNGWRRPRKSWRGPWKQSSTRSARAVAVSGVSKREEF